MAIGMDTAQGKPGDALEYTAGAGGAAYIVGPAEEALAIITASYSYVTDTPDFWRRENQKYPEHGLRFTGEPGEPVGIVRERVRQDLQRDIAIELRVPRTEHFAHPSRADGREDFVWAEFSAGCQCHCLTRQSS